MIEARLGDLSGSTLASLLRARARERPNDIAFRFLSNGEEEQVAISWSELMSRASTYAEIFQDDAVSESCVVIALPSGPDFMFAFLGCLLAGATAVPTAPVRLKDNAAWKRLESVVQNSGATTIVADEVGANESEFGDRRWIRRPPASYRKEFLKQHRPRSERPVFVQYTSGSVATPRGVSVSAANLWSNVLAISEKMGVGPESVFVSWLPLHHDMGLIGVLANLFSGSDIVLMPAVRFIQKPIRWLKAISRFQATHSGAPNFAFDLCVQRAVVSSQEPMDLSSWRVAFCGSEPVRGHTLERFQSAFSAAGFRPTSFVPCYGLAESTLLATAVEPGAGFTELLVSRAGLSRGEAVDPMEQIDVIAYVSCGSPAARHDVAILDPDCDAILPDGKVGEIGVAGPSVTRAYWKTGSPNGSPTSGYLDREGRFFLRTGDLGFKREGELFVTGRLKEMLISHGRKIYPNDLEQTAELTVGSAKGGRAASFLFDRSDDSRVVIVVEHDPVTAFAADRIRRNIVRAIATEQGIHPEVVLVPLGSIPRTTSGKLKRIECATLYRNGLIPNLEASPES